MLLGNYLLCCETSLKLARCNGQYPSTLATRSVKAGNTIDIKWSQVFIAERNSSPKQTDYYPDDDNRDKDSL